MKFTLSEIIVWLVVGALVGTLIGRLVTRQKAGFGVWKNLGVGLVGALIGGVLFKVFKIELFEDIPPISAHNIVAALIGSVIFLVILAILRKRKQKTA